MWFVVGGLPVVSKLSSCCLGVGGEVSEGFALFTGGSTARPLDLGLKGRPCVTRSVTPRRRVPLRTQLFRQAWYWALGRFT